MQPKLDREGQIAPLSLSLSHTLEKLHSLTLIHEKAVTKLISAIKIRRPALPTRPRRKANAARALSKRCVDRAQVWVSTLHARRQETVEINWETAFECVSSAVPPLLRASPAAHGSREIASFRSEEGSAEAVPFLQPLTTYPTSERNDRLTLH